MSDFRETRNLRIGRPSTITSPAAVTLLAVSNAIPECWPTQSDAFDFYRVVGSDIMAGDGSDHLAMGVLKDPSMALLPTSSSFISEGTYIHKHIRVKIYSYTKKHTHTHT
jgi:hypothetical protein